MPCRYFIVGVAQHAVSFHPDAVSFIQVTHPNEIHCQIYVNLAACTAAPTPVTGIDYSCTATMNQPIANGTACLTACSAGYEPGPAGAPGATCKEGTWVIKGGCIPKRRCTVVCCCCCCRCCTSSCIAAATPWLLSTIARLYLLGDRA
jgi:hypothetical protein